MTMKMMRQIVKNYYHKFTNNLRFLKRFFLLKHDHDYVPINFNSIDRLNNIYHPKALIRKLDLQNKDDYFVSIIVPMYNVENYIEECINSIINQRTNYSYEIIAIDDGSTDNTSNIIDNYKNISNLTIIHQNNQGLGQARNRGIEISRGKYIIFVDSDDLLPHNAIEILCQAIASSDYDVIIGNQIDYTETNKFTNRLGKIQVNDKSKNKFSTAPGVFWKRIYKKSLFAHFSNIEGVRNEDTVNAFLLPIYVSKIGKIDNVVYIYRRRPGSIMQLTKKSPSIKNLDIFYCIDAVYDFLLEQNISITKQLYICFIEHFSNILAPITRELPVELREACFQAVRQLLAEIREKLPAEELNNLPRRKQIEEQIILQNNIKAFYL